MITDEAVAMLHVVPSLARLVARASASKPKSTSLQKVIYQATHTLMHQPSLEKTFALRASTRLVACSTCLSSGRTCPPKA